MAEKRIREVKDFVQLIVTVLIANRKGMIASTVGLIIALSTIGHTIIYLDSVDGQLFNESMENANRLGHYDIGYKTEDFFSSDAEVSNLFIRHENVILSGFYEENMHSWFSEAIWWTEFNARAYIGPNKAPLINRIRGDSMIGFIDPLINFHGLSDGLMTSILPLLEEGGSLPKTADEVLILSPTDGPKISEVFTGQELTLQSQGNPGINTTLTITGVIHYNPNDRTEPQSLAFDEITGNIDDYSNVWMNYTLFSPLNLWHEQLSIIDDQKINGELEFTIFGRVFLDRSKISVFNLRESEKRVKNLQESMKESILVNPYPTSLNFFIIDYFDLVNFDIYSIITTLILVMTPLVVLSFFLSSYVLGLIRTRKEHTIGLLRSRGVTSPTMFGILFVVSCVEIVLAVVFGLFASIPLGFVSLQSKGMLTFRGSSYPLIIKWFSLSTIIGLSGLLFGLILNLWTIYQLSWIDPSRKTNQNNKTTPFWQSKLLDLALIALGLILFGVVIMVNQQGSLDEQTFIWVSIIGFPVPMLFLAGLSMFLTRFFPRFIQCLAFLFNKAHKAPLVIFSLLSMARKPNEAMRTVILLVATFGFGFMAIFVPTAIEGHYMAEAQYAVGGDLYFPVPSFLGDEELAELGRNITGLEGTTPIIFQDRYSFRSGHRLLALDPHSYGGITYQDSRLGLSEPLDVLLDYLAKDPNSILLREADAERLGKEPGENLTLKAVFSTGYKEYYHYYDVKIVGTFKYWPRLVENKPGPEVGDESFLVGNIELASTLEIFYNLDPEKVNKYGYLGKVTEGVDVGDVAKNLNSYLRKEATTTYLDELGEYMDSPVRRIFLGLINSSYLLTLILFITVEVCYVLMLVYERQKTSYIQRSIGMSLRQLFAFFFYESLTITVFSLVSSFLLSSVLTYVILYLAVMQNMILPVIISFDVILFVVISCVVTTAVSLSSLIPAYKISRDNLNSVLRMGL